MWASAYFKSSEFDSPDKPGSGEAMSMSLIGRLEVLREKCGFPFIITSGFRTPEHNEKVKGTRNSAHLRGLAADISITDSHSRYKILNGAFGLNFSRIEIGSNWVHLDVDESLPQNVVILS